MKNEIRGYFVTGLITLMPLAVVIFVLVYIYRVVLNFMSIFPTVNVPFGLGILINLVVVFLFILLVGFVTRELLKGYYKSVDGFFLKIPIINKIYGPVRQITDALYGNKKSAFRKVVFVEYPRKKMYVIGLVTKEKEIIGGKDLVAVFIPTSPLPMTGFLIYVHREEIIDTDLTVEEAMRITVSGGFVGRDDKKKA